MSMIQAIAASGPAPIHPAWQKYWMVDLVDLSLKQQMFDAPRFDDRIRVSLLADVFHKGDQIPDDFKGSAQLHRILELPEARLMQQVGFLWYAPVLSKMLFDPQERERIQISDQDDLRAIMRYRAHSGADQVAPLPDVPDYEAQGLNCLLAWFGRFPSAVQCRVRLLFPPTRHCTPEASIARAAFFESLTADSHLHWQRDQ